MKIYVLWLFLFFCGLEVFGQEQDISLFPYWQNINTPAYSPYQQLLREGESQLQERKQRLQEINTPIQWKKYQKEVKGKIEKLAGEFPERTPLNVVVTGEIERDGIMVDKLYFESSPGYYVTAAFFYPKNRNGKLPAILFCSGHSEEGYRSDTYQHMILNYVKKGFAVLAFDPIGQGERNQYRGSAGISEKRPTHEHSYPGVQTFLTGRSPAHFFIWDGIRALDYLSSRKEVDPNRIGVTGRSGGGTQTAYIAALDERVYAAAPECYITSFEMLLRSRGPQDAEQNFLYGIREGINFGDFLIARAPKPTLMVTTTRDIFSIQGARDTYMESINAFSAYDAKENFQMIEDDAGHASTLMNRERTYAFFQKHLNNPGDSTDANTELFEKEELFSTPSGNVYDDLGGENMYSLNLHYLDSIIQQRSLTDIRNGNDLKLSIERYAGLQTENNNYKRAIFSGKYNKEGYEIEKYLLEMLGGKSIPLIRFKPESGSGKTILIIDEEGKNPAAQPGGWAEKLVMDGYNVVLADLSGTGELIGDYPGGDAVIQDVPLNVWFAGLLTGKSILGIRVSEIMSLISYVRELGSNTDNLTILGKGVLTTDVLHASILMEDKMQNLILFNPLVSWQSIIDTKEYKTKFIPSALAGAIEEYDLPHLVRQLSRDKINVLMIDPVMGDNNIATQKTMEKEGYRMKELLSLQLEYNEGADPINLIQGFLKKH